MRVKNAITILHHSVEELKLFTFKMDRCCFSFEKGKTQTLYHHEHVQFVFFSNVFFKIYFTP
jgi:hypothetical protein